MYSFLGDDELIDALKGRFRMIKALAKNTMRLHEENQHLKKELSKLTKELQSRRRQSDVWRRKYKDLEASIQSQKEKERGKQLSTVQLRLETEEQKRSGVVQETIGQGS